jgi:hypothetical protein
MTLRQRDWYQNGVKCFIYCSYIYGVVPSVILLSVVMLNV